MAKLEPWEVYELKELDQLRKRARKLNILIENEGYWYQIVGLFEDSKGKPKRVKLAGFEDGGFSLKMDEAQAFIYEYERDLREARAEAYHGS